MKTFKEFLKESEDLKNKINLSIRDNRFSLYPLNSYFNSNGIHSELPKDKFENWYNCEEMYRDELNNLEIKFINKAKIIQDSAANLLDSLIDNYIIELVNFQETHDSSKEALNSYIMKKYKDKKEK